MPNMKKIHFLICLLFAFCSTTTKAQVNQVVDPSFEKINRCLLRADEIDVLDYWRSLDTSWRFGDTGGIYPTCVPDLIHSCSPFNSLNWPNNSRFVQSPHLGEGMVLVQAYYLYESLYFGNIPKRDYLQGRLKKTLVAGKQYCMHFHTNFTEFSAYAINKLGAYVDDGSIDTATYCGEPRTMHTPQVFTTAIITDSINWTKIEGTFNPQSSFRKNQGVFLFDPGKEQSIGRQNIKTQAELSKLLSISWITPQMDQLFISGASTRRKFLDRIVQNFEPSHAKHIMAYEHAMRERARLLKDKNYDINWISVLENNMAEVAIPISASRVQTVEYIEEIMGEIDHPFPKARMIVDGDIESKMHKVPAVQLEDEFRRALQKNRGLDSATGRTNVGIHKSDLLVYYKDKNLQADKCSTGEQKSLLLSIFLAEVFAQIKWRGQTPILLLDEVLAHLDENRRDILCQIIKDTKAQTWITGTESEVFVPIKNDSQFFKIDDSKLISV
jgi:recombinational DNA repair ATPase RecF